MRAGQPSRTARAAAVHRAAHQVLEKGLIFSDPLALRILGAGAEVEARDSAASPFARGMRRFIAMRSRFAEDALAQAVRAGVEQLVVLGAGYDTFAYRNPFGRALTVFEVDFPATQHSKRQHLRAAQMAEPDWLRFVPVDFESQLLENQLAAGGLDFARPAFFTWLGVVPYLGEAAIGDTLQFVAGLPGGAHVVFDFSDPPETLSTDAAHIHAARAAQVALLGEAWISHFEPAVLLSKLTQLGFADIEDLGPEELRSRYLTPDGAVPNEARGGHVVRASNIA